MVSLIDLLTNPYQKGFQKISVLNIFKIFKEFHQTQAIPLLIILQAEEDTATTQFPN